MLNSLELDSFPFEAVTLKVLAPETVGVPEILPVLGSSFRPSGKFEEDQVMASGTLFLAVKAGPLS